MPQAVLEVKKLITLNHSKSCNAVSPILLFSLCQCLPVTKDDQLLSKGVRNQLAMDTKMSTSNILSSLIETFEFGRVVHSPTSAMTGRDAATVSASNSDLIKDDRLLSTL